MFYHVKDLQFNARVSQPDVKFARLLLEQFGGGNGELKAAIQYFMQAFSCRKPYPDKYDLLMDIATEEFSHLEIVGATIQMLLTGISGELKNAADESDLTKLLDGSAAKEEYMQQALINPHFFVLTGGSPSLTDSQGIPWNAGYINANGDLTVDLRSNIAAESRAKIVYEYLMKFTPDPLVKETLRFLMTREVAHFQMFEAALNSMPANFPPGVLQSDPRFSNSYFNMSNDEDIRGPWNEGQSPEFMEEWRYIEDPIEHVRETMGLIDEMPHGTSRTEKSVQKNNRMIGEERKVIIDDSNVPVDGILMWSTYGEEMAGITKGKSPSRTKKKSNNK
ncbi:MAG TPA: manganese catalase family protein [Bacteroidales bacterium]|nr:manganese catalase family protein [Bacteroidales bacterium]